MRQAVPRFTLSLLSCLLACGMAAAAERDVVNTAVPTVQPDRMPAADGDAHGAMPIGLSRDWTRPDPAITRAVIVIPGWPRRDLQSGERAAKAAGDAARDTLIVTPQFLTAADVDAHKLPPDTLRWGADAWPLGWPAKEPAPVGSYAVVDDILQRLADRTLFPNLRDIVLAGHSAGGQFVQRYAAIGKGPARLAASGIHLRYVVANPSSYLYFNAQRPVSERDAQTLGQGTCAGFNRWPYGLAGTLPPYAGQLEPAAAVEQHYAAQDVVYLLGTADIDPNADGLARSCAAEMEGASRYARGQNFLAYLRQHHPETKQRILAVQGVGHGSARMYASPCGRAALFDTPTCTAAP